MTTRKKAGKKTRSAISKEDVLNIKKEFLARKENGRFKKGEARKFFEEASEAYGISLATIKNICYDKSRYSEDSLEKDQVEESKEEPKEDINKRLADQLKKTQELFDESKEQKDANDKEEIKPAESNKLEGSLESPSLRPNKPPYKFGDIVEVEVYEILSYGAFCRTKDGYEYEGLLHISEIKNGYVSSVGDYFEIGDIVKLKYKNTSREGKIAFTAKGLKISLKIKEQKPSNSIGDIVGDKLSKIKESVVAEEAKNKLSLRSVEDDELNEIVQFLNSKVGVLSPKAMYALRSALGSTKLVTFTMKMMEVSKDFEPDLGYLLISQIVEEIDK